MDFPIVFPCSYGFPMMFKQFSHDFPMVFLETRHPSCLETKRRLRLQGCQGCLRLTTQPVLASLGAGVSTWWIIPRILSRCNIHRKIGKSVGKAIGKWENLGSSLKFPRYFSGFRVNPLIH